MDLQAEKLRLCKLEAIIELIESADRKIQWYEDFFDKWGVFGTTHKQSRNIQFTKMAKNRLQSYYLKQLETA